MCENCPIYRVYLVVQLQTKPRIDAIHTDLGSANKAVQFEADRHELDVEYESDGRAYCKPSFDDSRPVGAYIIEIEKGKLSESISGLEKGDLL